MRKETKKEVLTSLNSEFGEFDLQELEQRLETDPLAVGGLLDLASTKDLQPSAMLSDCTCNFLSNYE